MVIAKLKAGLYAFGAALLAISGVFLFGYRKGKGDAVSKQRKDYIDTRKRIDETPTNSDADSARDRLRKRK